MKGKFYASGDLKQLESTLKEHEPYAVLVVSTTGIDKENEFEGHFPTRVVMKQFEFDDETKSYQSGFTFDKLVQAPQEAIQEALKNESSYDVLQTAASTKRRISVVKMCCLLRNFRKSFRPQFLRFRNPMLPLSSTIKLTHFISWTKSSRLIRFVKSGNRARHLTK